MIDLDYLQVVSDRWHGPDGRVEDFRFIRDSLPDIISELRAARKFIASFGERKPGPRLDWDAIQRASEEYDEAVGYATP
jgi:hypothetical protein